MRVAVLSAVAALLFAGCVSEPPREEFRAVAELSGLVDWRVGETEGSANVRIEKGAAGGFRVRVFDPSPRLTVERSGGIWTVSGPAIGRRWSGAESAVPGRLEGWLAFAEACEGAFAAEDGSTEIRTARFSFRSSKEGGRLKTLELVTLATSQRFRATFD